MNARYRAEGRQGHALRPHAERLRRRGRPRADRGAGELPERGRHRVRPMPVSACSQPLSCGRRIDAGIARRTRPCNHAHPPHQRRRHPRARASTSLRARSRARCPTTSGSSRRRPTRPASRIRCRSTIRCGCARSRERHFAVKGTPTDCVIMGVRHIMRGRTPDLVLSGVNRGQNIAEDVTYSGTVAGAMEGTILGVPSIALSPGLWRRAGADAVNWHCAEHHAPGGRSARSSTRASPTGILVNVNFPDCEPGRGRGRRPWQRRASARRSCCSSTSARTGAATRISGSPSQRRVHARQRHRPLGASPTGASR